MCVCVPHCINISDISVTHEPYSNQHEYLLAMIGIYMMLKCINIKYVNICAFSQCVDLFQLKTSQAEAGMHLGRLRAHNTKETLWRLQRLESAGKGLDK